jgi:hypothetical protein
MQKRHHSNVLDFAKHHKYLFVKVPGMLWYHFISLGFDVLIFRDTASAQNSTPTKLNILTV